MPEGIAHCPVGIIHLSCGHFKTSLIGFVRFQSAEPKLEPKSKEQSCKTKVVPEVERERERQREKERESREKEKQKKTKTERGKTKSKKALSRDKHH